MLAGIDIAKSVGDNLFITN